MLGLAEDSRTTDFQLWFKLCLYYKQILCMY